VLANAILFCINDLKLDNFHGADATTEFYLRINNIFGILNTRNILSKRVNIVNQLIKVPKLKFFNILMNQLIIKPQFNVMKNYQNVVYYMSMSIMHIIMFMTYVIMYLPN